MGIYCVAIVYALYIFYQYVCICSIFHKNHCFVSECCAENRLVGWKGRSGESYWGQGQLLRQEGTVVWSRVGMWWRQKKLLPGTFNLWFSNWVQGLIPETFLEGVTGKMSERGFIHFFTQSLDFYRCVNEDPEMRWDQSGAEKSSNESWTPSPLLPSTQPRGRTRTPVRIYPAFSTAPRAWSVAKCWQHVGPCPQ